MNNVQDQSFYFAKQEVVTFIVEGSISFQLFLKISFVVWKLSLLNSVNTIATKIDHLSQTTYL